MNKCPKCGHEWTDEKRAQGGKARWAGVAAEERKAIARNAANTRWSKSAKKLPTNGIPSQAP